MRRWLGLISRFSPGEAEMSSQSRVMLGKLLQEQRGESAVERTEGGRQELL